MAVSLVTRSLQAESLPADVDRLINSVISGGVFDLAGGHFQVVQQVSANMTVRVGSGTAGDIAVVEGSASKQGVYLVRNEDAYAGNAAADLTISEGDPSNPRIDLIVLEVKDDPFDSSGLNTARLRVVEGTPAASPVAPAVPDSAIALAEILVVAGESTSIVDGDITDRRVQVGVEPNLLLNVPVVRARGSSGATSTLSTTQQTKLSAALTIPTSWKTYDVDAWATFRTVEGGAAAQTTLTVRLNLNGTEFAKTIEEVAPANDDDIEAVALVGAITGMTTTGSRTVNLTTQLAGESGLYSGADFNLIAYAWRTS